MLYTYPHLPSRYKSNISSTQDTEYTHPFLLHDNAQAHHITIDERYENSLTIPQLLYQQQTNVEYLFGRPFF